jgi:hypothetical protein
MTLLKLLASLVAHSGREKSPLYFPDWVQINLSGVLNYITKSRAFTYQLGKIREILIYQFANYSANPHCTVHVL